jgi:hypothetical protein
VASPFQMQFQNFFLIRYIMHDENSVMILFHISRPDEFLPLLVLQRLLS